MSSPLTGPAIPPPPGVQPGQEKNQQGTWIASSIVILVVPTIFIALRVYTKVRLLKQWRIADTVCIIAWLLLIGLMGIGLDLVNYGVGYHGWDVTLEDFSNFAKYINAQQIIYMPAIFAAKAAVLLQLNTIFVTHHPSGRWWIIMTLIGLNAVFFTILLFLEAFECTPRAKIWDPTVPGHCINIEKTFVATGAINVVDDLFILALPLVWVWKLNSPVRTRIGIGFVFAAGIFACVCSIMRLAESILSIGSADITFKLMPVSLWATAEVAAGIVVCCLPALPRLFRRSADSPSKMIPHSGNSVSQVPSKRPTHPLHDDPLLFTNASQTRTSISADDDLAEKGFALDIPSAGDRPRSPRPAILRTFEVEQTSSPI